MILQLMKLGLSYTEARELDKTEVELLLGSQLAILEKQAKQNA